MLKSVISNPYAQVGATVIGIYLCFLLPDLSSKFVVLDFVLRLAGFFIAFFAFVGLVAAFLRSIRPPVTNEDVAIWKLRRKKGKTAYVKRFVALGLIPCLALLALASARQFYEQGLETGLLVFVLFLAVIIVLSLVGSARLFWDFNERELTPTNSSK